MQAGVQSRGRVDDRHAEPSTALCFDLFEPRANRIGFRELLPLPRSIDCLARFRVLGPRAAVAERNPSYRNAQHRTREFSSRDHCRSLCEAATIGFPAAADKR